MSFFNKRIGLLLYGQLMNSSDVAQSSRYLYKEDFKVTRLSEDMPSGYYWFREDWLAIAGDIREGPLYIAQVTEPVSFKRKLQRMVIATNYRQPLAELMRSKYLKVEGPIPQPSF